MKTATINISLVDHKIQDLMKEILKLESLLSTDAKIQHDDLIELHTKITQLSELVVCFDRLEELHDDKTKMKGGVSLQKLFTFCTLKENVLYELRLAAIKENNINYAELLFKEHGPIDVFLLNTAIQYNRLNCLLKIIRIQIDHNIITANKLENILEVILLNKKASALAEAIMIEFSSLISEQFLMKKYISMGNMELLNHFIEMHNNDIYEMGQSIFHIVQEESISSNFDIANSLYKQGVDVFNYKYQHLQRKICEEKNPLKIAALNLDMSHIKNLQYSFWQQVINHDLLDQVIDMIKRDKPKDKKLIKIILEHFILNVSLHKNELSTQDKAYECCPEQYMQFFETIHLIYPDGSFDLDCASFFVTFGYKNELWKLLQKHSNEKNETQLTFIEEVQLIALKLSHIDYSANTCLGPANIAEEIGQQFLVDAPTKKVKLLESLAAGSNAKKDEELQEIKHCQEIQAFMKPSFLTSLIQRFTFPLFNSTPTEDKPHTESASPKTYRHI